MANRILLGIAPANDSPTYFRTGHAGMYISRPTANVLNCSDGDLIFDTSSGAGILQILGKGKAVIPKAGTNRSTGNLVISTSRSAPADDSPVYVWWNALSRGFGNSITNMTFLDVGKNLSVTRENALNLVSGRELTCKTYITDELDPVIALKFDNPSQENAVNINYTVFRESAHPGEDFVFGKFGLGAGGGAAPEEFDLSLNLKVQIDTEGGDIQIDDPLAGPDSVDGRYYTVIFPNDFVYLKNQIGVATNGTTPRDPFRGYRDFTGVGGGRINARCHITLTVPADVDISGKKFNNHLTLEGGSYILGVSTAFGFDKALTGELRPNPAGVCGIVSSYAEYGPGQQVGSTTSNPWGSSVVPNRPGYEREALNDPCIIINLNSLEWTDYAINGTKIVIENEGDIIGAGGFGGYGMLTATAGVTPLLEGSGATPAWVEAKSSQGNPGGGGGGGAGHHVTSGYSPWPHSYLQTEKYYHWSRSPVDVPGWPSAANSVGTRNPGYGGEGYAGAVVNPDVAGHFGVEQILQEAEAMKGSYGGPENGGTGGNQSTEGVHGYMNSDGWNPGSAAQRGSYDYWRWSGSVHGDPMNYPYGAVGTINYGTEAKIDYNNFYVPGRPNNAGKDHHGGYVYAGHGGSCIYVCSNTESNITGFRLNVINKAGGRIMGGGGGGGGGLSKQGQDGGNLGERPKDPSTPKGKDKTAHYNALRQWGRYGDAGRIVWWNAANVAPQYTILNQSSDSHLKGLDHNDEYIVSKSK